MRCRLLIFNIYCDEISPLQEFLEAKDWVEKNSKFDISYQHVTDSPISESEKIHDEAKDCYWIYPGNLNSDRKSKFKEDVNVNLLFWGHESKPCLAGGTFGGREGIYRRPFVDIPYDVWWWSEPPNPEFGWDLSNQGAAVVVHELVNAIQCIIRDPQPYGLGHSDFTTYEDAPPEASARDQHAWVLSQITDEMYADIQRILTPGRLRTLLEKLSELIDRIRRFFRKLR